MKVEITVLCENTTSDIGALAEHGWSVLIESEEGKFLFDTGGGRGLENNLKFFNKGLEDLEGIILSHHHLDHTGGLERALKLAGPTRVYSHPELFKESFSLKEEDKNFLGLPFTRAYLESLGADFSLDKNFRELAPGIFLSGEIKRNTNYEKGDKRLMVADKEGYKEDELLDDQCLIIKRPQGLVLILGCAHSGLINTLNHVIEKTGESRITHLIGGTHLGPASEEQKERTYQALKDFDIGRIGVSHCTGSESAFHLKKIYGEDFFFCNVGTRLYL